jgi:hypothetical protein
MAGIAKVLITDSQNRPASNPATACGFSPYNGRHFPMTAIISRTETYAKPETTCPLIPPETAFTTSTTGGKVTFYANSCAGNNLVKYNDANRRWISNNTDSPIVVRTEGGNYEMVMLGCQETMMEHTLQYIQNKNEY